MGAFKYILAAYLYASVKELRNKGAQASMDHETLNSMLKLDGGGKLQKGVCQCGISDSMTKHKKKMVKESATHVCIDSGGAQRLLPPQNWNHVCELDKSLYVYDRSLPLLRSEKLARICEGICFPCLLANVGYIIPCGFEPAEMHLCLGDRL